MMKLTYTDLIGQTQELILNQPQEVKEALDISRKYSDNGEIEDILNVLSIEDARYVSYSHN